MRSQSVQRVIEAAVPLEASAPCNATVITFSPAGTPAASANCPLTGYGPTSTFPLLEKVFVPNVTSVPSSRWYVMVATTAGPPTTT